MKISPLPLDEKQRLDCFQKYHILDTATEQDYDNIVALAAQLCETPVALITFIDQGRQWFKAKTGLDITETHRDLSFCAHTILQNSMMTVTDASEDERFFDNPLVTGDPNIRFYCGLPLTTKDGYTLGTLAVIDRKPRQLSTQQISNLHMLARQVINLLELRCSIATLEEKNNDTTHLVEEKTHEIRDIFERVSDAFVALDKNWCYKYVNVKAEQIFNRPHGYLIGKHIWTEFPEGIGQPFHKAYEEAMATQQHRTMEAHYQPYNLWFENHIYPSPTGLSIYFHDITERKRAELAVQHSEVTKKLIINSALDAIICMNRESIITVWNPQAEKIFGWSEEDVLGRPLVEIIIPKQYRERHLQGMKRYLETGDGVMLNKLFEITALNREQKEFPIELFITVIKENQSEFFCSFIRDITQRKKTEEKIIKEKDLSNSFINSLPGIFYLFDSNGKFIRWNNNFETVSGYNAQEVSRIHPLDLFDDEEKELVKKKIMQVFEVGKADVEANFCTKYKTKIPYYLNGSAVNFNGIPCLAGMGVDITDLKRATESHLQAEERFRNIFENAIEGIYQTTIEGQFITVNPSLARMFGYDSPYDLINSITDLGTQLYTDPKDRLHMKQLLEENGVALNLELKLKKKNGDIMWAQSNDRAVKDAHGNIRYFEGTVEDITARKEAERKLQLQQQLNEIIIRAQALFIRSEDSRHAFDVLLSDLLTITESEYGFIGEVLLDSEGKPYLKTHTITNIAWNDETRKYYNDNIEEGLIFSNLKTLFGAVMTTGKPVISNSPLSDPRRGGLPHGHPPLNAFMGLPFGTDGTTEGMLGLSNRKGGYDNKLIEFLEPLISTITHLIKASKNEKLRKQIEIELHKQFNDLQKTNHELDHFVYSVSHDLRAPLASILGLINVAELEELTPSHKSYLQMIRSSINRLDGFIRDILDYSRNSRVEPIVNQIDFREIILDTQNRLAMIDESDRLNVKLEINDTIPFYSDKARIEIVINNLLSNAIKYQDRGKQSSEILIQVKTFPENVYLTFSDNGIGIKDKYVNKIFNIFYRATEKAKGSGLGLYITKEAILKLGGTISVQSEFGISTTFEITIPNSVTKENFLD